MPSQDAIYRFGPFELRTRTREVYKHGTRLRLRPQPFQILLALVERSGDGVTREELRRLLWPAETFVDFEHGLNTSIKELRGVLDDSAGEPRYIETLPKLGYRFIVPVVEIHAGCVATDTHAGPSGERPRGARVEHGAEESAPGLTAAHRTLALESAQSRWRWTAALGVCAVLIAIAVASVWRSGKPSAPRAAANGRVMLAVLPFENLTGDADQDYFSDGMTEEMITQLGRLDPEHLRVIARTSVMRYKHTQEPLQQIGRELGVQYVLEGSIRRDSGKVRISAQLIRSRDRTPVWAREYDRQLGSVLALEGEIAQEIADEIQLTLGNPREPAAAKPQPPLSPSSYEAYDLYLRGRYFWDKRTKEGFQQAAKYFQQSIAKDPHYARPYAGLADTYAMMSSWFLVPQNEYMPKARAAALRALEIDDGLAEAHTSLAVIAQNYDYDWRTAEKEYQRAIELDPSYATAHQWYAECLSFQGRFDEALAESERARQLDPLSLIIATDHGAILYFSRQYDRAIEQFRSVLAMDPSFNRAQSMIISAYVEAGRFEDALAGVRNLQRFGRGPWTWADEAYVYGRWGRRAQARRALAKFQRLTRHVSWDPTPGLLGAYAGMGSKDETIALLQKAYLAHSNALVEIKVQPNYDPLRPDPRFQKLLRQVGLAN